MIEDGRPDEQGARPKVISVPPAEFGQDNEASPIWVAPGRRSGRRASTEAAAMSNATKG